MLLFGWGGAGVSAVHVPAECGVRGVMGSEPRASPAGWEVPGGRLLWSQGGRGHACPPLLRGGAGARAAHVAACRGVPWVLLCVCCCPWGEQGVVLLLSDTRGKG